MQSRELMIVLVLLLGAGLALWVAAKILLKELKLLVKQIVEQDINARRKRREAQERQALIEAENNRKRREDQTRQALIEAQNKRIEDFRKSHPVEIVGVSEIALLKQISDRSDEFIATVKAYRPQIPAYDNRFRSVSFSYPFELFFPRSNSADDGPDPTIWETTPDSLAIKTGRPLRPIYESLSSASEFPVKEPSIISDLKPPPRLPKVQVPTLSIKIIEKETSGEIDFRSEFWQQHLSPRLSKLRVFDVRQTFGERRSTSN
jgi:hypothetical protein